MELPELDLKDVANLENFGQNGAARVERRRPLLKRLLKITMANLRSES